MKKSAGVKTKLLFASIVPPLVVGIGILLLGISKMSSGMESEVLDGLLSSATLYKDVAAENTGTDNALEDRLKADSGIDFTWFDGDTRSATSVVKSDGTRPIGTKASAEVVDAVINKQNTYVAKNTDVAGSMYYVAYVPYIENGVVTGMGFAGKPMAEIQAHIRSSALLMGAITLAITVIVMIFIYRFASDIGRALTDSADVITAMADGRFIEPTYSKKRNDEIGAIAEGARNLSAELGSVISDIRETAHSLKDSSFELAQAADRISTTSDNVSTAVQEITEGATEQANNIQQSTVNVGNIDTAVQHVSKNTGILTDTTAEMEDASRTAEQQLEELASSIRSMAENVDAITIAIGDTEKAVKNINNMVDGITSIASQTNLLALNASIEAARAGDAGRGFAVVAEEIGKLAEESANMTDEIRGEMQELFNASRTSIEQAEKAKDVGSHMNSTLEVTTESIEGLISRINTTIDGVNSISEDANACNSAKDVVVDAMNSLSAISEENAAATQQTSASMQELNQTVTALSASASELRALAESLTEDMSFFK